MSQSASRPKPRRSAIGTEEEKAWVSFYRRASKDPAIAAEVLAQLDADPEMKREHLALYLCCRESLRVQQARDARNQRIGQFVRWLMDALLDLQDVQLSLNQSQYAVDPLADIENFQNFLLLFQRKRHMHRDGIDQTLQVVEASHHGHYFGRNFLAGGNVLFELGVQGSLQRGRLGSFQLTPLLRHPIFGQRKPASEIETEDLYALTALDQDLDGSVGQLEQLQHRRQGPGLIQVGRCRIIDRGILLGRQQDLLVHRHHGLERKDRFLAANEQRHDHLRIHHHVPEGQQRQLLNTGILRMLLAHRESPTEVPLV